MKIFASYYYTPQNTFGNTMFEVDHMPQTAEDMAKLTFLIKQQLHVSGTITDTVVIISYQQM